MRLSRAKKVLQQLAIAPVMALCKQLSSLGPHKYDALVYADRAREIDKALSGRSHSLQRASPSVTKLYSISLSWRLDSFTQIASAGVLEWAGDVVL